MILVTAVLEHKSLSVAYSLRAKTCELDSMLTIWSKITPTFPYSDVQRFDL